MLAVFPSAFSQVQKSKAKTFHKGLPFVQIVALIKLAVVDSMASEENGSIFLGRVDTITSRGIFVCVIFQSFYSKNMSLVWPLYGALL